MNQQVITEVGIYTASHYTNVNRGVCHRKEAANELTTTAKYRASHRCDRATTGCRIVPSGLYSPSG